MATNQRQAVRRLSAATAAIPGLTTTQILELIQDETLGGTQADVGLLQIGDIIYVSPNDIAQGTIDNPHDAIAPAQGLPICRVFLVVDFSGAGGTTTPAARHALIELNTVDFPLFW